MPRDCAVSLVGALDYTEKEGLARGEVEMARIPVPAARATINESSEGLLITIPTSNWYAIPILGFWLAMWLFGEISVTREIISATRTRVM
jgi:hypothetical protein